MRLSSQVVCYSAPGVLDVIFDIGGVFDVDVNASVVLLLMKLE